MLQAIKAELDKKQALTGELPPIIDIISDSIPSKTIPERMKHTISATEIMLYASQFRRNIHHWDGGEVPINTISFIVTGSGAGKDSAVNAVRKCFKPGYEIINRERERRAKRLAIEQAQEAGEENPQEWESYKDYYIPPKPLFVAPSTTEGFVQHLNDIETQGIGSGYIYAGEIGAELAQNQNMVENIKLIAELYDLGNKEVKVLKARENQSSEIKGLPVSAMFVGSPANLLYDEAIKRKFQVEFSSKLARRSFFCFCPEEIPEPDFSDNPLAVIDYEEALENAALDARENVSHGILTLAQENIPKAGQLLEVDPEVRKLFILYKRYNTELSKTLSNLRPMSKLVRRHLQWKALKLSGAIAIFNQHDTITEDDYIEAMRFCELLDQDLGAFELELVKEPYEVFADFMQSEADTGQSIIGLHNLRKLKYIPTTGQPAQKMKELCHLAAAYDPSGTYTIEGTNIIYKKIIKTDNLSLSYKPIDTAPLLAAIEAGADKKTIEKLKGVIASTTAYGLETDEGTFEDFGTILTQDYAFSPFTFRDGVRGKENIIGGTKVLVLDIDHSAITADECHFMLSDINHHIALSSDPTNEFKFRILIELDSVVEVDAMTWQQFYLAVADELAIQVDPLPQSQIFFAYKDRPVFSTTDADPLPVRDYIMAAHDRIAKSSVPDKQLKKSEKETLLANEYATFEQAFNAKDGEGSRKLIWAAKLAYNDLGATKEDTIALIQRINDYWTYSMDEERLQTTIVSQILRWS